MTYKNRDKQRENFKKWRISNPEKIKENIIKWRLNNPEKAKDIAKRYREKHKAEAKENSRLWRLDNPEKAKETAKRNYETHKKQRLKGNKKWRQANPEKTQEYSKRWLKTDNGRLARHSRTDKRRREMGSNLLNPWFKGCNRHHITKNDIICIPEDLHKSSKHSHKKPQTMGKINILAWDFMERSVL